MPRSFGRTPVCSIADGTSVPPGDDRKTQCRTQREIAARAALELHLGHSLTDAEWSAARAALELHLGHSLTDAEWSAARARLLDFASILRAWDRKATTSRRDT